MNTTIQKAKAVLRGPASLSDLVLTQRQLCASQTDSDDVPTEEYKQLVRELDSAINKAYKEA